MLVVIPNGYNSISVCGENVKHELVATLSSDPVLRISS